MKKILFLILLTAVFTLSSCSNEDDDGTPGDDPIIGTWVLTETNPPIIDPADCPEDSTLTFNEDGTGNGSFYLALNDCEEESTTGMWDNVGDSNYIVELPQPIGRQQGEVEFQGANKLYLSVNYEGIPISLTFERE